MTNIVSLAQCIPLHLHYHYSTSSFTTININTTVDHTRGVILVGTYDGHLYVLNQSTGRVLDRVDCEGSIYAAPVLSCVTWELEIQGPRELQCRDVVRNAPTSVLQVRAVSASVGGDGAIGDTMIGHDGAGMSTGEERDATSMDNISSSQENPPHSSTSTSTLAFVCTTRGMLHTFSYPSSSSPSPYSSSSPFPQGERVDSAYSEGRSFSRVWTYDALAPIFGTPLVVSTIAVRSSSNLSSSSSHENGLIVSEVWRRDVLVVGVVDGTLRCLSISTPLEYTDSQRRRNISTGVGVGAGVGVGVAGEGERKKGGGVGAGIGVELWRVSFASKPIFGSVCALHTTSTSMTKLFYGYSVYGTATAADCTYISAYTSDIPRITTPGGKDGTSSPPDFPPHIDFNVVFGSHDGYLRGVSGQGDLLWGVDLGSVIFSSPCSVGGGVIAAATTAGRLFLIDCTSDEHETAPDVSPKRTVSASSASQGEGGGRILGQIRFSGEIYSSPVHVRTDNKNKDSDEGRLFIGCRDDKIHALSFSLPSADVGLQGSGGNF